MKKGVKTKTNLVVNFSGGRGGCRERRAQQSFRGDRVSNTFPLLKIMGFVVTGCF